MAQFFRSLFRGYLDIVRWISGPPGLNRGLKYMPKPLRHQSGIASIKAKKTFNNISPNLPDKFVAYYASYQSQSHLNGLEKISGKFRVE